MTSLTQFNRRAGPEASRATPRPTQASDRSAARSGDRVGPVGVRSRRSAPSWRGPDGATGPPPARTGPWL